MSHCIPVSSCVCVSLLSDLHSVSSCVCVSLLSICIPVSHLTEAQVIGLSPGQRAQVIGLSPRQRAQLGYWAQYGAEGAAIVSGLSPGQRVVGSVMTWCSHVRASLRSAQGVTNYNGSPRVGWSFESASSEKLPWRTLFFLPGNKNLNICILTFTIDNKFVFTINLNYMQIFVYVLTCW